MKYLKLFEDFEEADNPHGGEFNYGKLSQEDITKIKSFIEDLKIYTKEHSVKLVLSPDTGVQFSEGGFICNGYFDGDTRTLACALGKDVSQWLIILLHESCHMDQWVESVPAWTENESGMENIDKWLAGDDDVVKHSHSIELFEALPLGQLAIVPGTSHGLVKEKPEIVTTLINNFLSDQSYPVTRHPIRRTNPA